MKVTQRDNKIEIKFKYTPALVSFCKQLDNRTYDPLRKSWLIPLAGSASSIEKLAARGFDIDMRLLEAAIKDKQNTKEVEALATLQDTDFTTSLPLYGYQKVGAAFLSKIGSGILGDQPGTGKTLMSMAVCEAGNARKVLVFCPSVLKHQWKSELNKFVPHRKAVVIEGDKAMRNILWQSEAEYYIANYELLLRDLREMERHEWDYILADECTKISNPQAKSSKAIKKLKATHKIAMSGTLISNAAQDVWNICDFVSAGCMGNYWNFINRYCVKNDWGGIFAYQNMDELRDKLKRYMIRRTKEEVLPELPAKIETDITFTLSDEERELQTKIKKELLFQITSTDISKIDKPANLAYTIAKFQRLRMLADSLELLGDNTKSSKLEVLKELLEDYKDTDTKILIFSEFAEMCKILKRELVEYNPLMIIGETPSFDRNSAVIDFNSKPEHKVLILSSAGQYGINLQSASVVINYDTAFSLAKLEQRVGRAYRIGQKKHVHVYNLLGIGTADMAIKKLLHKKAEVSDHLLGDKPLNIQDIEQLLKYE